MSRWQNQKKPQIQTTNRNPAQVSLTAPIEADIEIGTITGAVKATVNRHRQIVIEAIDGLVHETGLVRRATDLGAQGQASKLPQTRITKINEESLKRSLIHSTESGRHNIVPGL